MTARILVTTDLSEESYTAFSFAKRQAELEHGELILLSVLEDYFVPSVMYPEIAPLPDMEEYRTKAERATTERLNAVMKEQFASAPGVSARVLVSASHPASAIAQFARETGVSLIVVASNGRGALGTLFMGSTVQRLLQEAPCPLLVVPRPRSVK